MENLNPVPNNIVENGIQKIPNPDYRNHPAYGKLYSKPSIKARLEAFRRIRPHLRREFTRQRNVGRRPSQLSVSSASPTGMGAFERDGVLGMHLSEHNLKGIQACVTGAINTLSAQREGIPIDQRRFLDNSLPLDNENAPGVYELVTEALNAHDILEIGAQYLGEPIQIQAVNLMIYDGSENHWKDHFFDISLPDSDTAYMHMDSAIKQVKCLIYLNPVTEDNGPFSYVVGSNRLKIGFWESIIRKANDFSRLDKCDPETRKVFSALPKFLQKKCEFGNDIANLTPASQQLLAAEKRFTSEEGNMIFFDNGGIHRGGMVRHGHRHILQVPLTPAKH